MTTTATSAEPAVLAREGVAVTFEGVVKDYGSTRVLRGLDLQVRPGELVSLLGPSGCGKTTALRVLAGLEHATEGAVRIGGQDVSGVATHRRDIGMVFQAYSLFPHLTVVANTMFGLRRRRVPRAEAARRAAEALELVGLGHLAERYPHQLSGGQQQRVALARALVTAPKVLLLDEPLSALDAKVRSGLRDEIRRLQLRLGITTIFVTHDQEEALAVSDRIAVMDSGRIEQLGTPEELYLRPATPTVAAFVGLSSVVPAQVTGGAAHVLGTVVPVLGDRADGPAEAFLRPENVRLLDATATQGVPGTVEESMFLGSLRRTLVRTVDGDLVRVQHRAEDKVGFGDTVRVALDDVPVAVR
ncbi:spermidine/putrescine ABC transporter ATP-binding protein [Xylanimonas oleitrophica]|uniref:ABC-type quaternary amine transporter n=1 Tax=Xylanimonas oleitrophica TaxID=2607479 RepID=A0A2W5X2J0_9MICO|nr:ABC transporter ATP-binding protein [Xylanimonas oleitrophica]PZR55086.1 spermidine/putrescine ABC transporter ATP-binding protein [Xylanimonas oleitrophica]